MDLSDTAKRAGDCGELPFRLRCAYDEWRMAAIKRWRWNGFVLRRLRPGGRRRACAAAAADNLVPASNHFVARVSSNRCFRLPVPMRSAEDLPKEDQIDEHAADHAVEKPFRPEQPTPLGAERGEDAHGQHDERDDQLFLIALKCAGTQDVRTFGEIAQIGEAKESWKDDEKPGAQLAFAPQLQCRRSEEESDDDDGEERAHRAGMSRIAGIGPGLQPRRVRNHRTTNENRCLTQVPSASAPLAARPNPFSEESNPQAPATKHPQLPAPQAPPNGPAPAAPAHEATN